MGIRDVSLAWSPGRRLQAAWPGYQARPDFDILAWPDQGAGQTRPDPRPGQAEMFGLDFI